MLSRRRATEAILSGLPAGRSIADRRRADGGTRGPVQGVGGAGSEPGARGGGGGVRMRGITR
jgi:hypothetical protein